MRAFNLPVLEAMACGTPVLAANATATPEIVGHAGLLFAPLSVEEIAEGMTSVIGNQKLRNDLGEKGFRQAEQFSWARSAQATWDALRIFQ